MNREIWSPVSERELQQQEAIERFDATERAAAAEKAKEKELAERARAQGLAEGEVGSDEELLRVVGPEKRGG
jgi:hypothetical protein